MAGMLYLVPTPIGNLGDISVRCRKTLAEADFIAAEDTRVTLKLLNYLELKKTLVSYYEHNQGLRAARASWRASSRARRACLSPTLAPRDLRSRRRPRPSLRGGRDHSLRHSGAVRSHHGALHLRTANGALLLRGLPLHQQKEPGASISRA